MDNILQATDIVKDYANHRALDGVSIAVPRGSVYGLMGPNGAGKTTLIRIINRITAPDSGELLFDNRTMTPIDVMRIGYLPEERGLYKKMKVGEQALYLSRLKGMSRSDAMRELQIWFRRFEIQGWWDKKVEELSKGMAQKVQFIVTVIHKPELLIFDEPFSGFDPINAQILKDEILERKREGATIIFSTHNMSSVEEICDHVTLISGSHNILSGRVDAIRREWGTNAYRLDFEELSTERMQELLLPLGYIVEPLEAHLQGVNSLMVTLPAELSPRELITVANGASRVHNISQLTPSMNDIFIRAVRGAQ